MKHLKDPTRGEGKQIFSTMPELNAKHYVGHEFIEISEASWISPATSIVVIVAIIISRPANVRSRESHAIRELFANGGGFRGGIDCDQTRARLREHRRREEREREISRRGSHTFVAGIRG
jgi:hypothetical protein